MWSLDIDDDGAVSDAPAEAGVQILDVEQNTEAWRLARLGIPTASAFHKAVSVGRADQPSAIRRRYMMQLLGERLTGTLAAEFDTPETERGHYDEDVAANDYAFQQNVRVETIGFMRRGALGASPDRVIVGKRGIVEIKSKKPELHLDVLTRGELPGEHRAQVQGALMVSGYEFCDFVSYCRGLPLFVLRILRDEQYIGWLCGALDEFNRELDALEREFLATYYGGSRAA